MPGKRANKGLNADQVADALRRTHGNMSAAARMLGVERNTIRHYMDRYPTVRAAHDEAAAAVTDIAEGHLVKDVLNGKWEQVRYWLENKARERGYGIRRTEISGPDGEAITLQVFDHGAAVAGLARRPAPHPPAPGADEGGGDG